jgi:hypothetical protein
MLDSNNNVLEDYTAPLRVTVVGPARASESNDTVSAAPIMGCSHALR